MHRHTAVINVRTLTAVCFALAALALPGAVGAGATVTQPLVATVGSPSALNAYVISLKDSTGAQVTHLDTGTYTVNVHDYATVHNFDLTGPGVSKATDIDGTEDTSWTITVTDGTYRYVCDAHPTVMRGSFTAGNVVAPPPVKKLSAQVGPKRSIIVKTSSGARVKKLAAGKYKLTVKDLSKVDNFHLSGGGVNKKTGVKARGTVTWTVTFRAGKVAYRSDTHRLLRGAFVVTG
jgi:plastocyanin